jgi:hypothetical protein
MRINAYDHTDHVVNTTSGPVAVPQGDYERVVNTSRVTEEDLVYTDEDPEILAVLPATGWHAVVGGDTVALAAFVALDTGRMYGVAVDGRIDLVEGDVEKDPGFSGYKLATDVKEN